MFSSRKWTLLQLLMLALISGTISAFVPLEIPALHSTQCKEANLDISNVLETVQEMLIKPTPSSHPLSCLEVKESSPSSPSGYYTLSDGTGNTNIVYCNMDELYSCPSFEQVLRGIQLSLDHTIDTITSQLDDVQDATNTLSTFINNTQNNLLASQDVTNTLSGAINNTVNSALTLTKKLITAHFPTSCQKLIENSPDLTSGTYNLNDSHVYCHFEDLCNTPGPWTRVAFLNMSDPTQNCSSPFELIESNGVRACGRPHPLGLSGYACQSVTFPVNQTAYSQVCGRVLGYQYYKIDGFDGSGGTGIDDPYVDGVSLTHGSPRQHIWSFAAAYNIYGFFFLSMCWCKESTSICGK